jgi:hypothetical protein
MVTVPKEDSIHLNIPTSTGNLLSQSLIPLLHPTIASFHPHEANQRISLITEFVGILRPAVQEQKKKKEEEEEEEEKKKATLKRDEYGERDIMRSFVGTTRLDLIDAVDNLRQMHLLHHITN